MKKKLNLDQILRNNYLTEADEDTKVMDNIN